MNFTLKIWRQKDAKAKGGFETYKVENISADTSFLEMLDILNNNLIHEGKEPVAFDHDCREGICGMCSLHIDGQAHGPSQGATTCQIYMRKFKDGATITIEPWRSAAFPVIKDLVVNRSSYDQILQAGGFISVRTNSVPDGNAIPIPKADADESMDAAACIGCGACAATCKNGSAMLFVAARVSSLAKLPQGRVEGARRAVAGGPAVEGGRLLGVHHVVAHRVAGLDQARIDRRQLAGQRGRGAVDDQVDRLVQPVEARSQHRTQVGKLPGQLLGLGHRAVGNHQGMWFICEQWANHTARRPTGTDQ